MLENIASYITSSLSTMGYLGIIGIMAIESTVFPIIIPSEVFLLTYGVMAYKGEMMFSAVLFCATLGILIGSFVNYYMSVFLGRSFLYKYGKYFGLKEDLIKKWEALFLKYSKFIIFFGRFVPIPAVKHIVTIPAGLSRMNIKVFTSLTTLGGFIFSAMIVGFGYWFGKKTEMLESFSSLARLTIYCLLGVLVIWFAFHKMYKKFHNN
jgi:membrane protein DedA with SNARE-associated domain